MVLRFRLLEMKLGQFLDLEELAERNKQIVLPQLSILQRNLAASGKRIGIGRFAFSLQTSLNFSLENTAGTARFSNNLVSLNATKFQIDPERRFLCFRLHRKMTGHV